MITDKIPTRVICGIMMFFASWVNYMMRVNISVNLLAMVPDKPKTKSRSEYELVLPNATSFRDRPVLRTEYGDEDTFTWTVQEQAYVLSGYFWGYAATNVVGGTAAELWGPKKMIFLTTLIGAIATVVSPALARVHYTALVAMRLLNGLAGGFLLPACHAIVARWAPPAEKGKFVSALLGGAIGTVFTWCLTGYVIKGFGWAAAFYVCGGFCAAYCILWWYLVYDTPVKHPRISEEEKKFILESLGNKVEHGVKVVPPFKKIFTSFPFICQCILQFGNAWGVYFVMTAAPKFLKSVLGFDLKAAGALASLPYLGRMTFSMVFGIIGDKIVARKLVSMTILRKFFCLFSHIIPGLLLGVIGYSGGNAMACVMLITFSLGFNGAACLTSLAIHQDLAPNFAGTLFGIANGFGNTAGFITPLVTAHFTKQALNTFDEWRPVFIIGASVYIAVAVFYILFGSATTQSWNYYNMPGGPPDPSAPTTSATTNKSVDKEIEFTRHLHSVCPQIEYYYMGFYIHSCRKMRYKGSFYPSDLLCPETYKWFPLLDCIPKLEASPYTRLDPDVDSVDENYPKESDLNYIPLWVNGAVMLFKAYKRHSAGKKNINKIPTRIVCGIMMFFACWVNYMMRVNISVNLLAMVPDKPKEKSRSEYELVLPNATSFRDRPVLRTEFGDEDTFTWTVQEQAYVLSGYFWGYAATNVVGGTAAELWGPKRIVLLTTMLGAIATLVSPALARVHVGALVAMRLVNGIAGGFLLPACHAIVARWAPPAEKGKFVSALLGGAIGTVFTWCLSGYVIKGLGWAAAFYVCGALSAAYCILWWYLIYDTPVKHPRISEEEKKFILDSLGHKVEHGLKVVPPFKKIFTSFPFICQCILHFGNDWGLYFVMTAAPKFLKSVLGFDLKAAGALASLPYLGRMTFSMVFGVIGDKIVARKLVSMTIMRKFFCLFSHIIPGLLLGTIGYSGGNPMACVMLITFSLAFNGAACLTSLAIHQDLSPNFAGTLFGIANGVSNTAGFITPLVTASFTKQGLNTFDEWRPVFIIGASVYIAVAVFYIVFGSATTQSWNYYNMPGGPPDPSAGAAAPTTSATTNKSVDK